MSKAHMPPVPPTNRSDKGPGGDDRTDPATGEGAEAQGGGRGGNTAEQGQAGNSKQNTTHQGFQQDR
jgi:hypothetical protein